MKIHSSIELGNIHLDLIATDSKSALSAVADRVSADLSVPPHKVVKELMDRESLGSTSVGGGFAIPHCKLAGLRQVRVALARFAEGFDFAAADGMPVRFFFIVLSPPDQPAAHLQVLSQIARILKRQDLRDELLTEADAESLITTIRRIAESEGL